MKAESQLGYEAAGVAFLIAAGIAAVVITALLSPLFPWISGPWVFVALVAAVLGTAMNGQLDGGDVSAEGDASIDEPDGVDAAGEGGVLDVDLVNWANGLVGTTCLRCEDEITYIPLGVTEGRSEHRIECGCTVIESTAKE